MFYYPKQNLKITHAKAKDFLGKKEIEE